MIELLHQITTIPVSAVLLTINVLVVLLSKYVVKTKLEKVEPEDFFNVFVAGDVETLKNIGIWKYMVLNYYSFKLFIPITIFYFVLSVLTETALPFVLS